ncbi:hypothetical protein K7I13_05515 [Brucepastera parasyntrophica]|uniref:hypothetical protein n=1 Tax=Brucepastera parasyntrophica TaxID=2880008 RepID=UPI00210C19B5|nr:hypothetical protein [Brucepastera parasyntrophica]ULQ60729.1 hypothetical protein K7I13_05515 [Brucepastera parasyntrophica]
MDNDNEVDSGEIIQQKEVKLFLQGFMSGLKTEPPALYDLETEYEKTRKNRSWFVIILITAAILLVAAGLWLASSLISRQTRDVSVGIEEFEDLNLRNLLDMASRVESALMTAISEKANLEGMMKTELDTLSLRTETERHVISSLSLPAAEETARLAAVNSTFTAGEQAVRERYMPRINICDAQIAEYREQMTTFDLARIEEAQLRQENVNSERRLFELEKQQIRDHYEEIIGDLRYQMENSQEASFRTQVENLNMVSSRYRQEISRLDPVFSDSRGREILSGFEEEESLPVPFEDPPVQAAEELGIDSEIFNMIREDYQNIDYLINTMFSIPWRNSASSYLRGIQTLAHSAGKKADDFMQEFFGQVVEQRDMYESQIQTIYDAAEQNEQQLLEQIAGISLSLDESGRLLSQYEYFFRSMVEKSGNAGYVIDPRDRNKILVYVDPLYGNELQGKQAFIFRTGTQYIGSVILTGADGVFTARISELAPGQEPAPNDRILLNMTR